MAVTPTQITAIKMDGFYNTKRPDIPFYAEFGGMGGTQKFYYIILYGGSNKSLPSAQADNDLKNTAVDRFITHYAPGFYSFIVGSPTPSAAALADQYTALRAALFDNLSVINLRSPSVPPPLIAGEPPVFNQSRVLYAVSKPHLVVAGFDIENLTPSQVPSAANGLSVFNNRRNAGATASTTSIDLSTIPTIQGSLKGFMTSMNSQMNSFQGQLNMNVNFGGL